MKQYAGLFKSQKVSKLVSKEVSKKKSFTHILSYSSSHFKIAAFTLVEVLITLGIIGIVAALTMPALIANYQKKETVTRLKKVYSTLWQAVKLSEVDNGEYKNWSLDVDWEAETPLSYESTENIMETYFFPYLKVMKKCGKNTQGCFANPYYYLNGTEKSYSDGESNCYFSLTDGTSIKAFHSNDDEVQFLVDLNGPKTPNIVGKDIFELVFNRKYGITRAGISWVFDIDTAYNTPNYGCSKRATGGLCSAVIILNNWEIDDRYPW